MKSAQLQLAEERHRGELFALEQTLRTTEAERNDFKLQASTQEADHALTKKKLQEAEAEIKRLNGVINFQDASLRSYQESESSRNWRVDGDRF